MKIGVIYLLNMHSCLIVNNSSSVHVIINYYKIGVQNQNMTRVASKTTCYLTSSISFQMSDIIDTLSPSDQLLSDGRSPMQHHFLVPLRNTSHYGDEIGCEWHFMLILSCCDFISRFIKPRYEFITYDNTHFHKCIFEPAQYPVFCFS